MAVFFFFSFFPDKYLQNKEDLPNKLLSCKSQHISRIQRFEGSLVDGWGFNVCCGGHVRSDCLAKVEDVKRGKCAGRS